MKVLRRKEDLRLATITLYKAEMLILLLGLAKSVYDLFEKEITWENVVFGLPGITITNILAILFLLWGLKKPRFAAMGIGYLIYSSANIIDFYIVNKAVEGQLYEENNMSLALSISAVLLIVFFISVVALLVRQANADERITDKDRKKWFIPGILYLFGYFSFFLLILVSFLGIIGLRDIITGVIIIAFISLILAKLLEIVALFSCMKWLVCPEVNEYENIIEESQKEEE